MNIPNSLKILVPVTAVLIASCSPSLTYTEPEIAEPDCHVFIDVYLWKDNIVTYGQNNASTCFNSDKQRHGQWEVRFSHGGVDTGPYVDGKRHGQWKLQYADGDAVITVPYVDGKWHGLYQQRWVGGGRWVAGSGEIGPYVDGEQHGEFKWIDWNRKEKKITGTETWVHGECVSGCR